ncbi:MAG: STAS domain-containing protein [Verrucomicrobiae bacterium]|nr:STAS domain-containing protein [Verrucomicrobiae bacterium]
MSDTPNSGISFNQEGSKTFVKISGRGSFQNSPSFKKFYLARIESGTTEFHIDMADCPAMDSTFLGTLTSLSVALKKRGGGRVYILEANARNLETMKNLGIDRLFVMDHTGEPAPSATLEAVVTEKPTREEATKQSIDAHETLVEAFDGNETKFRDVISLLKEDLSKKPH